MQRVLNVLWMLVLFEMGVFLLFLPWLHFWEVNYFLSRFPSLTPFLLHPSFRGAVSGLGALDILLAARMLRRPAVATQTRSV